MLGVLYSPKDRKRCIEEFNKAISLDPNDPDTLNFFAYQYLNWGDYENGIEYIKKVISLQPGKPNPLDSLAQTYFCMGKLDDAIANYKKALEVRPDFYASIAYLQYVYAIKEDYPEAIRWLDKFIEIAPTPSIKLVGYYWKGFYSLWLGNLEKSLGFLQRAEDLAEATNNKGSVATINRLRSSVYYDKQDFVSSRKYNDAWLPVYVENAPASKLSNEINHKYRMGLIEFRRGERTRFSQEQVGRNRIYDAPAIRRAKRTDDEIPYL